MTWLAAVRRGVGLGVVGVSVAERKPPLEVDPASCAYPLSLFLPRPSLDDLSVPVLSVVQSHVLSLQLSRAAFRPLAPHAHSEFRFPSTERGSYMCLGASLLSIPPCPGYTALGLRVLGPSSVRRRRPPAARFRPLVDSPSPSPLEPPRPRARYRPPPILTTVLGPLCGWPLAPPASASLRVHSLLWPCSSAIPFPYRVDVSCVPRTLRLSPTVYQTPHLGPPYRPDVARVVSSYSLTLVVAPPLVLPVPSSWSLPLPQPSRPAASCAAVSIPLLWPWSPSAGLVGP